MFFQKFESVISKNPQKLFQIDGYGALISTFMYLVVLRNFEFFFGMPYRALLYLGVLALVYAAYSMTCYWIKPEKWRSFMNIIATANLLHCCLVLGMALEHFQKITVWGSLYFMGEIIIVLTLAIYELKMASV